MTYSILNWNESITLNAQGEQMEFTWTIPNFSKWRMVASTDSGPFSFDGNSWKFHIYATFSSNQRQNDSSDSRHDASDKWSELLLRVDPRSTPKSEKCCNMEISVLNARGNKFGTRILHERFPFERRFKLVSASELHDQTNDLLPNDQLSIHFLLFCMKTSCRVEDCQYAARTHNPLQLLADFAKLFTSKRNADVIFKVQNTNIAAHKSILTARSPVFAAMFQHRMKEKESGEVDIADVTPAVFNKLLQFIYTADCPLEDSTEGLLELLMAADKYDIPDLKQLCEIQLGRCTLNVDTAIDLLILSDLHNAKILRRSVDNFIKKKISLLMDRPEWQDLEKNYAHLARTFDVEIELAKIRRGEVD